MSLCGSSRSSAPERIFPGSASMVPAGPGTWNRSRSRDSLTRGSEVDGDVQVLESLPELVGAVVVRGGDLQHRPLHYLSKSGPAARGRLDILQGVLLIGGHRPVQRFSSRSWGRYRAHAIGSRRSGPRAETTCPTRVDEVAPDERSPAQLAHKRKPVLKSADKSCSTRREHRRFNIKT